MGFPLVDRLGARGRPDVEASRNSMVSGLASTYLPRHRHLYSDPDDVYPGPRTLRTYMDATQRTGLRVGSSEFRQAVLTSLPFDALLHLTGDYPDTILQGAAPRFGPLHSGFENHLGATESEVLAHLLLKARTELAGVQTQNDLERAGWRRHEVPPVTDGGYFRADLGGRQEFFTDLVADCVAMLPKVSPHAV